MFGGSWFLCNMANMTHQKCAALTCQGSAVENCGGLPFMLLAHEQWWDASVSLWYSQYSSFSGGSTHGMLLMLEYTLDSSLENMAFIFVSR